MTATSAAPASDPAALFQAHMQAELKIGRAHV